MKLFASVVGIALGATATGLWLYLAKWLADREFWKSTRELTQMLIQEPGGEDFFQQYLSLLRALGVYLVKTTCRVAITITPILIALHFLAPRIAQTQFEKATSLLIYPLQPVELRANEEILRQSGQYFSLPSEPTAKLSVSTPDWSDEITYDEPVVITSSSFRRMAYELCGYKVIALHSGPNFLLIRPAAADMNPCWPYLNDIEFLFWTWMVLASCVAGFIARKQAVFGRPLQVPFGKRAASG